MNKAINYWVLLKISHFHIVQHIGRTFLNHRVKETTARLKGTSHSQRGLGKKLKRYWKLLQKEEAKLNYDTKNGFGVPVLKII
ncbi:hypothetical protein G8B50_00945 [Enterococcus durans]|uniref:hypothetical protein n=1 Tax=Enterococcus durans TaxID=53345 RepID=UPI00188311EB|nr:hypothetical protein [Enterococcus durans]